MNEILQSIVATEDLEEEQEEDHEENQENAIIDITSTEVTNYILKLKNYFANHNDCQNFELMSCI